MDRTLIDSLPNLGRVSSRVPEGFGRVFERCNSNRICCAENATASAIYWKTLNGAVFTIVRCLHFILSQISVCYVIKNVHNQMGKHY